MPDYKLDEIDRRIVRALQADGRMSNQDLADKVSAVFVPTVIALAILTLAVWLLIGQGATAAFTAAVGAAYEAKIGYAADFYVAEIADGPRQLD